MECNHCGHEEKGRKMCLDRVPIFSNLTLEEKSEISKITVHRKYEKGEAIYLEGETSGKLYVIHSGRVKITKVSDNGKEQILRILGPGDFMGELSLFMETPISSNAEVLEDTTVCSIEGRGIKEIMERQPGIALKIIEEMSKRLEKAENLIESIGLHDVERRIAETLLEMANGNEVSLSISKKDLASHIGMSQETLSRKLTLFQDMGWIKQIGQRRIIILDSESLGNL